MPFSIDRTAVRLGDGAEATIRQDDFRREDNRHAFNAFLRIEQPGKQDVLGKLRFTAEAHDRLPGRNDEEKSAAVAQKLAERIGSFRLEQNFQLIGDADDSGVVLDEISN